MRRVERSDGIAVNIMDWVMISYAVLVIPLMAILVWYIPYQDITYRAVAADQSWTYLFPNLRRVLNVPFVDPQRVSGALVFLNIFFVLWFVFALLVGPFYIQALKGWRERLARYGRRESCKLMFYSVLVLLSGGFGLFWYNGGHSWMWGSFFYKYEVAFMLFNLVIAWWVTWAYLIMIVLFLKLTRGW